MDAAAAAALRERRRKFVSPALASVPVPSASSWSNKPAVLSKSSLADAGVPKQASKVRAAEAGLEPVAVELRTLPMPGIERSWPSVPTFAAYSSVRRWTLNFAGASSELPR